MPFKMIMIRTGLIFIILVSLRSNLLAEKLIPGKITEIEFPKKDLPETLYNMANDATFAPCMTVRLPDDYDPTKTYPLLVYVPGFLGGPKGNIENAQSIAGTQRWIIASLPLFKKSIDRTEVGNGIIISFQDYPSLSKAYEIMLGKLFKLIPNIDREKSAMVGFSNGSQALAVLITNQNEFILTHFKSFCLVDHGMFHLTDLHKKLTRNKRYLILVGDKEDMGRELKIRGAQLLQDEWRLLNVDLSYQIMKNTGHEFPDEYMDLVGKWIRNESTIEQNIPSTSDSTRN